jgi:hypothetical protein
MKSIYGGCNPCGGGDGANISIVALFALLMPSYEEVFEALKTAIVKLLIFEIKGHGISTIVACMGVLAHLPFAIRVRRGWKQVMPGVKFDQYDENHTDLLKDLYLINGEDWREDPLFKPKVVVPPKVEGCA